MKRQKKLPELKLMRRNLDTSVESLEKPMNVESGAKNSNAAMDFISEDGSGSSRDLNSRPPPLIRAVPHEKLIDLNSLSEAEKRNSLSFLTTNAQNQSTAGSSITVTSTTGAKNHTTKPLDNLNEQDQQNLQLTYRNKEEIIGRNREGILGHILLHQSSLGINPRSQFDMHPNSRKRSNPPSEYYLDEQQHRPSPPHQTYPTSHIPNSQEGSVCQNSMFQSSTRLDDRRIHPIGLSSHQQLPRLQYIAEHQIRQMEDTILSTSKRQCPTRRDHQVTANMIPPPKRIRCASYEHNLRPSPDHIREQFLPSDHTYSGRGGKYSTAGNRPRYFDYRQQDYMPLPIKSHLISINQGLQNELPVDQGDGNYQLQPAAFNASTIVQRFDEMLAHLHQLIEAISNLKNITPIQNLDNITLDLMSIILDTINKLERIYY